MSSVQDLTCICLLTKPLRPIECLTVVNDVSADPHIIFSVLIKYLIRGGGPTNVTCDMTNHSEAELDSIINICLTWKFKASSAQTLRMEKSCITNICKLILFTIRRWQQNSPEGKAKYSPLVARALV